MGGGTAGTGTALAGAAAVGVGVAAVGIGLTAIKQGAIALGNIAFSSKIINENGVTISHNYPNDHGNPVHVHVNGGGPSTKVGPNGKPTLGQKPMSQKQSKVFWDNIKAIRRVIKHWQRWIRKL